MYRALAVALCAASLCGCSLFADRSYTAMPDGTRISNTQVEKYAKLHGISRQQAAARLGQEMTSSDPRLKSGCACGAHAAPAGGTAGSVYAASEGGAPSAAAAAPGTPTPTASGVPEVGAVPWPSSPRR
jgi:hypothetical protein